MANYKYPNSRARKRARDKSVRKYQRAHTKTITLRFNKEYDADVIKALEESGNKNGYIKKLVRQDIEKRGE